MGPHTPGPLSAPQADRLNETDRLVREGQQVIGTAPIMTSRGADRQQRIYNFGSGTEDNSFLALLTKKTGTAPIAYDWIRVQGSGVTYTQDLTNRGGVGYSNPPAYHIRNRDLPVVPQISAGPPPTYSTHWLSVVRIHVLPGNVHVFDEEPWADLVRRTNTTDAYGERGYFRYFDQNDDTWKDGFEVRITEAG